VSLCWITFCAVAHGKKIFGLVTHFFDFAIRSLLSRLALLFSADRRSRFCLPFQKRFDGWNRSRSGYLLMITPIVPVRRLSVFVRRLYDFYHKGKRFAEFGGDFESVVKICP